MTSKIWNAARRTALSLACLTLATGIWGASVHLMFTPELDRFVAPQGVSPRARALSARYLELWGDPQELAAGHAAIRASNPEWDFMGRTYLVLALANMALREPEHEAAYLDTIDAVIADTLARESSEGVYHFLMGYAHARPFVEQPARSIFVDGEIALMLGARRLIEDREDLATLHRERVALMVERMEVSPTLSAESYPDECWTFCNTTALAAIRIADVLDGSDHSHLLDGWVELAKRDLVDPGTGLLIASYTLDGRHMDGPEGSTLWMAAHNLQVVDPVFAADQYARAREELGRSAVGFGYAREWPRSWVGPVDVDSGPTVPLLEANAGSSGLALLGAAAFDDREYLQQLLASLELAGFPQQRGDGLAYAASNHVGDAVLLYALTCGPLWERVRGEVRT